MALPRPAKITLIMLIIVGIGTMIFMTWWWAGSKQISKTEAEATCNSVANRAKTTIAQKAPEYKIVASDIDCVPIEDEMGATDYKALTQFKLEHTNAAPFTKGDYFDLTQKLPRVEEAWDVTNIFDASGRSQYACLNTLAYIDNDGSFIAQGGKLNGGQYRDKQPDLIGSSDSNCDRIVML